MDDDDLWNLTQDCWKPVPETRPTAPDVCRRLGVPDDSCIPNDVGILGGPLYAEPASISSDSGTNNDLGEAAFSKLHFAAVQAWATLPHDLASLSADDVPNSVREDAQRIYEWSEHLQNHAYVSVMEEQGRIVYAWMAQLYDHDIHSAVTARPETSLLETVLDLSKNVDDNGEYAPLFLGRCHYGGPWTSSGDSAVCSCPKEHTATKDEIESVTQALRQPAIKSSMDLLRRSLVKFLILVRSVKNILEWKPEETGDPSYTTSQDQGLVIVMAMMAKQVETALVAVCNLSLAVESLPDESSPLKRFPWGKVQSFVRESFNKYYQPRVLLYLVWYGMNEVGRTVIESPQDE